MNSPAEVHPGTRPSSPPERRTRLPGWARDLALLISGILIAFSLDAFWEERQERARDRVELEALATELEEVVRVLVGDSTYFARARDAASGLASAMRDQQDLSEAELLDLTRPLIGARTSELPLGAYGLVSRSGALGRIRDAELRSLLASWPAQIQDTAEGTNWLREQRDLEFNRLLNEHVTLFEIRGAPASDAFPRSVPELLRDRDFYGALSYRQMVSGSVVAKISEHLASARTMYGLLTREWGTS